ncbi:hypothetical protein [Micromonospora gifhornensis]
MRFPSDAATINRCDQSVSSTYPLAPVRPASRAGGWSPAGGAPWRFPRR